jgi:GNAT superfamily N-acetyltransferase
MRLLLAGVLLLSAAALLPAQDSIKLDDGRRLTGEIVAETEAQYLLVTKLGEKLEIEKSKVTKLRRGRGLAKRVVARLEDVAQDDASALFAVVQWAQKQKSLRRDAERLARRVLAIDPEHLEARKLLGHVKLLGTWYLNRKVGMKALRGAMKERGLIEHEGGFGTPAIVAQVESAPKAWLVDESSMLWRPLAEIMRERGFAEHRDEWYGPEEKDIIDDIATVERTLDLKLRGAGVGESRVVATFGRKGCIEHAKELEKAREYFIETFRPERRRALMGSRMIFYVLRETTDFEAFLDKGADSLHSARPSYLKFARPTGVMSWGFVNQVIHQQRGAWKEANVARVGMAMMDNEWTGRVSCPDWIGIASAHLAEIAVYGAAKTWWVAQSRYADQEDERTSEGRTLDMAKVYVREKMKKMRTPVMRSLFGKKTNQMTVFDDQLGIVLMSYFLEKHEDGILDYLFGKIETDIGKRFEAVFGHSFEEEEKLFRAWLGL